MYESGYSWKREKEHDKYSYFGFLHVKFLMVSVWLELMDGYIYADMYAYLCANAFAGYPYYRYA